MDADASVWVASGDDVPALFTEAGIMELPVAKLKLLIPDLLEANGILPKACDSVPFHLHTGINIAKERKDKNIFYSYLLCEPLRPLPACA